MSDLGDLFQGRLKKVSRFRFLSWKSGDDDIIWFEVEMSEKYKSKSIPVKELVVLNGVNVIQSLNENEYE